MKYLHIMRNDKFINPFIDFINKNFSKEENTFFIMDGLETIEALNEKNVKRYISKGRKLKGVLKKLILLLQLPILYIRLFNYCKKSEKIYFHALSDPRLIFFLFIFRHYLKKSYWIMWGADLYSYNGRKKKSFFYSIEDYVKENIKGYISYMEGEFRLVKKWFKAKGNFYYSFTYPSNLYKEIDLKEIEKKELWIQIGNSADSSNNHLEILEKLSKFKDMNIKLFCILSYGGSEEYKKQVIGRGSELFKDKFFPILNFMEFKEYMSFLSSLDIAIFAHNRQQGFGNITSLLSMKKTIYLKEKISTFEMLNEMKIAIKSFDRFTALEKFDENILENNRRIIKENFSEEKLIEQWKNIFEN
jgi:4-alpha-L-fucosyltransferase (fuc4NAc transferase)